MYECMRIVPAKAASVIGLRDPAAKGAIVKGMRETATNLGITVSTASHEGTESPTSRRSNDSCRGLDWPQVQVLDHWLGLFSSVQPRRKSYPTSSLNYLCRSRQLRFLDCGIFTWLTGPSRQNISSATSLEGSSLD